MERRTTHSNNLSVHAELTTLLILICIAFFSGCGDSEDTHTLEMKTFSFHASTNPGLDTDVSGTINGSGISLTVPPDTDVTQLVASFTSTGNAVSVNGTNQRSGVSQNDFSTPVTYTVSGEGGTQSYTVTVIKGETAPTDKDITSFKIHSVSGSIHGATIELFLPVDKPVDDISADFSTTGSSVSVNGATQLSGITKNDYSAPLIYDVTAADGSVKSYTVTITVIQRSMWVSEQISEIINDLNVQTQLINFAKAPHGNSDKHINRFFLTIPPAFLSSNKTNTRNFISRARDNHIQIELLAGFHEWVYDDQREIPVNICKDVISYNQSVNANERISGVHFDIEPHKLGASWRQNTDNGNDNYNDTYENNMIYIATECKNAIDQSGLQMTLAFDVGTDYSHYVTDLMSVFMGVDSPLSYVGIMNYFDTKDAIQNGTSGIGGVNQNLANSKIPLVFGVETIMPDHALDEESFWQEGNAIMETVLTEAYTPYEGQENFAGIAIHHHGSYTILDSGVVPDDAKDITSFSINSVYGTIAGTQITVNLPAGTVVTSLTPAFITTGDSVYANGTLQQSGTTSVNFTNAVTYTVNAGDGSSKNYTVTVNAGTMDFDFFDDFDGTSIDTTKWFKANRQWGPGNGGVIPEMVSIENGFLKIEGHGDQYGTQPGDDVWGFNNNQKIG